MPIPPQDRGETALEERHKRQTVVLGHPPSPQNQARVHRDGDAALLHSTSSATVHLSAFAKLRTASISQSPCTACRSLRPI